MRFIRLWSVHNGSRTSLLIMRWRMLRRLWNEIFSVKNYGLIPVYFNFNQKIVRFYWIFSLFLFFLQNLLFQLPTQTICTTGPIAATDPNWWEWHLGEQSGIGANHTQWNDTSSKSIQCNQIIEKGWISEINSIFRSGPESTWKQQSRSTQRCLWHLIWLDWFSSIFFAIFCIYKMTLIWNIAANSSQIPHMDKCMGVGKLNQSVKKCIKKC